MSPDTTPRDEYTGYATTPAQPDEVGWVSMPFEVDICGDIIPSHDLIAYARRLRTNLSEAERSLKELATRPAPSAAVVLPAAGEVMIHCYVSRDTAQAILDLIAARLPVWQPVEPGTVIKAGTRWRCESGEGATLRVEEETAALPYNTCRASTCRYFIDPRTVPAEPEDPAVAVVEEWWEQTLRGSTAKPGPSFSDLLARIDAARADA